MPDITEQLEPERTILTLSFEAIGGKRPPIKTAAQKAAIIEYLTDHISGNNADFAQLLGLKSTRVKELLRTMVTEGILEAEGNNKTRIYKLKS